MYIELASAHAKWHRIQVRLDRPYQDKVRSVNHINAIWQMRVRNNNIGRRTVNMWLINIKYDVPHRRLKLTRIHVLIKKQTSLAFILSTNSCHNTTMVTMDFAQTPSSQTCQYLYAKH